MDGGLCLDDVVADEHSDGDEHPFIGAGPEPFAQQTAHRRKAHIDPGEEEHQPDDRVDKAHCHPQHLPATIAVGHQLEDDPDAGHRQQAGEHFFGVFRQSVGKLEHHILRGDNSRYHRGGVDRVLRVVEDAQQQDHQNWSDAAQRHEAEAVFGTVSVAAGGREPNAKCHNERHRQRTGGDAAGIEGHRGKAVRREEGKYEQPDVAHQQHL